MVSRTRFSFSIFTVSNLAIKAHFLQLIINVRNDAELLILAKQLKSKCLNSLRFVNPTKSRIILLWVGWPGALILTLPCARLHMIFILNDWHQNVVSSFDVSQSVSKSVGWLAGWLIGRLLIIRAKEDWRNDANHLNDSILASLLTRYCGDDDGGRSISSIGHKYIAEINSYFFRKPFFTLIDQLI